MSDESTSAGTVSGVVRDGETPQSSPDMGFTLGRSVSVRSGATGGADTTLGDSSGTAPVSESDDLGGLIRIERALRAGGPPGWERLEAVFALTVSVGVGEVVYSGSGRSVAAEPDAELLALVRRYREQAARSADGPWWRLLIQLTRSGEIDVVRDYGDEPFPDNYLFAPEVYREDLAEYPRERLPLWLAAYVDEERDRQSRPPRQAAIAALADRAGAVWPTLAAGEFPAFPITWSRWATIAASFVAVGSARGPRMLPSLGWFEGSRRGGSTLYALSDGRAVLSGGLWDAPELDAVYNGGADMPKLFAGAPEWVADPVLNPRAGSGLLSFCYWWEAGHWYRGESPSAEAFADAVPGVWTTDTVVEIISALAGGLADDDLDAVAELVLAAESGLVTRETVTAVFGDGRDFDIDGALYQFSLAGLAVAEPRQMPEGEAIDRVRNYILGLGLDTTGYPLDQLTADRFSCGWRVYSPVPRGEIAIGRSIFYIADDGILAHASSSMSPADFIASFESDYYERHRLVLRSES